MDSIIFKFSRNRKVLMVEMKHLLLLWMKTATKTKILVSFASVYANILKLVATLNGNDNYRTGDDAVS